MTAPKLRFKEFDGDWINLKYKDVLTIKYGKDHKLLNDGDIPVYGTGGVMRYVDQYLYNGESILIGRKGTIDQPKYVNEKFWTVDTLFYSQIKENSTPLFLYQHALQINWLGLNEATGVPSLNTTSINNVDIAIPSKEEQTKIATFLSAVDKKISQLSQKHELLSQYKQGMMQKLFSQQIRFKADDGSEFGEWEHVKLENLVDLISGFAFKSDFFAEDGNKLITPKNFTTTGKANFTRTNTKWTTEISDEKYICSPNDLLVLLTDLTQSCELLGKPILLSQGDGNVLLNQRIVKIIPNKKLEKTFLLYLLLTDDFHELIVSTASGTTVKHSSNKVLQSFNFYLPCLEEQTKIANFLSAIDQKIEVVAQQIEQAKTWKKGLLQQMFV
ncbi:restriction endonuclease subunit S [Acinetobacter rudis]|uniref:Type I restriction modification DNA specificity domain-containing protein n=1 Tax=Acinetobacter rudis CIP 110305 TaxID=421052 RepID=S3NUL5_9GAMM|nr:restriction endonuclease subunit S [Acinetobacter rudis]EPF70371.1 hypothetical protein F945_03394 [Acinetobacter rudis CIP 110305]